MKRWGNIKADSLTVWKVLGGPVIGFHTFPPNGLLRNLIFIVGDRCRPKYFGSQKLFLRLGEEREVQFDWQASEADHHSTCLSKGLFYVQNSGQLGWMTVTGNKATFFPPIQDVYPSNSYLSLHYGGETLLLEISPFILYTIPAPPINLRYTLITSQFGDFKERWLSSRSTFKFSDNVYDAINGKKYGEIIFAEIRHETKRSEDCAANCVHTYVLKAAYTIFQYASEYSLVGEEVIVT